VCDFNKIIGLTRSCLDIAGGFGLDTLMKKPSKRKPPSKRSRKTFRIRPESRRAELLALAKSYGIKGLNRMTKPQLIVAIQTHQKKFRIAKPVLKRPPAGRAGTIPPTAGRPKQNYDDLPWSYGETELVLMPVDPFQIYAYWDFSPEDWNAVRARRQPVVLRVYDVTMIRFNGKNAHSYFDLPVALEAQNWYVNLWSAEKSLCAELGWVLPDGSFQPVVRSNVIQTPRAGVSIYEDARWVEIRWTHRRPVRLIRRKRPGAHLRPGFWPRLEAQAAEMTSAASETLSSRLIGMKTPLKRPA